jgi:hypothetical protein
MRFLRRLVVPLALASTSLLAPTARAGTLQVEVSPTWKRPSTSAQPDEINRKVCLDTTATATFSLTFTTPEDGTALQLWAGDGCQDDAKRTDDSTTCVHVMDGEVKAGTTSITVRVQDLLKKPGSTVDPATAAVCDEGTEDGQVTRTLYFLVVSGGAVKYQGTPAWVFKYDTRAPAPPTSITAGAGEEALIVGLTSPDDDNIERYRFYCTPTDSGTVDDCTAAALVPGKDPVEMYACGTKNAQGTSTFTTDSSLGNGVPYAVAVASEDDVGNVGVLSEIACGIPKEVTGFYEAYRAAGGEAGGGFCSFAPARRGALPLGFALLVGCAALVRRRR